MFRKSGQKLDFNMRVTLTLLIASTILSSCGPKVSPEQKAQNRTSIAQTKAAKAEAKNVTVNGKTFSVAHVTERNQALVDLVGTPTPYFVADVEAASRMATGCDGSFEPGVLAFLGGDIGTTDLAELKAKISGGFKGWLVSLDC